MDRSTHASALAALLAALAVPWTVVVVGSSVGLVFPWGLFNPGTRRVTTISAYLFEHTMGLPDYLLAWPTGVALYLAAVAATALALVSGREDPRLTAGLLAVAGASVLAFALGIGRDPATVAVPTGSAVLWLLAWWFYGPAVARAARQAWTGGSDGDR